MWHCPDGAGIAKEQLMTQPLKKAHPKNLQHNDDSDTSSSPFLSVFF
jgi:hypothetical protein